jgi:hypothetical protein
VSGGGGFETERNELQKKLRELNRRVQELTEDVKLLEETNLDLKSEKSRL